MKRKLFLLIGFIGLIAFFTSCEKDETRIVISDNPVPPSIETIPSLALKRTDANKDIVITAKPVEVGFKASVTYILEAAAAGTDFANVVELFSGTKVEEIKFKVSDLNGLFLRRFKADESVNVDFRIRAILVVDAGASAPMEYVSATKTAQVTPFGLPRLNLMGSGRDQKIESAKGDGVYFGYVKLDATKAFTLKDPDTNTEYGAAGAALAAGGAGISVNAGGWYQLTANTNDMSYKVDPYMIGLIGSATPNGWDTPDQKMDYDVEKQNWSITLNLVDGEIKFRKNDGWAWNLGGTPGKLTQGGENIAVTAGNYTITLTIINDQTGTYTIVKN
jgi:starch-binding outer membrane protein SusE/F